MAAGPIRSEVEGGLSGPANPIPDQSLDCGCGQLPCPKLAKYATRKLFVGLICWIGIVQAAAQAYYGLTSSTIARMFRIEANIIEWLSLITDGIVPFIIALPIAYWGDRIHRAAWTGALVLLQSVGFICLIIPHFTRPTSRVIEETTEPTHLSLYADENPELCFMTGSARISIEEEDSYIITLCIVIIVRILNSMGNISYLALAISYLDDNTRKRHVAIPISFIIAVKIVGLLFGYLLAWGCLRVDSDNLNSLIESYREQIGAWWLGWPILAILLAIGGLPISWMPRRLTSEVVEQAAASILDLAGRTSPISESTISNETKYGDTGFIKSLFRLVTNKILMCNIFASVFCTVALINFADNEDIYLESRFYAPRPTGLYLGFNDPLLSRIISTMLRPIIIGLVIIISGIVIVKFRPRAKWIAGYNIIICILAAITIVTLAFLTCRKPPIVGANRDGSISLLRLDCNRHCRCSSDASFSPICDRKNSLIFYSPCHAGCTNVDETGDVKIFTHCSCIEEITEIDGNNEAVEGPCGSTTCQYGWIVFQVSTILTYSLIASGAVGSLLIGLRSIYIQDKALAIGLWITTTSIFVYSIGKMIYWQIANWTCIQRGYLSSQCHLHDTNDLGAYLSYLTALLLVIGVVFELLTFVFCQNLRLYRDADLSSTDVIENPAQAIPLMTEEVEIPEDNDRENMDSNPSTTIPTTVTSINLVTPPTSTENNQTNTNDATFESSQFYSEIQKANTPLQYGPLGPGNPRKTTGKSIDESNIPISDTDFTDDEQLDDNNIKRAPISLSAISYRRLEIDSDAESSISSVNESIKLHRDNEFLQQGSNSSSIINNTVAGFTRTDDIEFTKFAKRPKLFTNKNERPYTGDFNEIGIPIVNYPLTSMNSRSIGSVLMAAKLAKDHNEEPNRVDRSLSPGEHTSSGFGSSTSDLYKRTTTPSDENHLNPGKKSNRPNLPAFSTAL